MEMLMNDLDIHIYIYTNTNRIWKQNITLLHNDLIIDYREIKEYEKLN